MARNDDVDEILRLRCTSLRMTFCWFEDAKVDEILTTPLRSAQDDNKDGSE